MDRTVASPRFPPTLRNAVDRRQAGIVYYPGERRKAAHVARGLFHRTLHGWELAGLAGTPDDAAVDVGVWAGGLYLEMYQPATFRYCGVFLFRRVGGQLVQIIDDFSLQPPELCGRGLGLRIFARQLRFARSLGVARIETVAGRGPRENGYYTWPRFGFNGPLPAGVGRRLPHGLRHARSILEVMATDFGRQWWCRHGETLTVAFDLAPASRSWQVFRGYLAEKTATSAARSPPPD